MQSFLASTGLVAVSEIGDKTQLLALVLACRFRRPGPIIAGIFAATILNHALAVAAGAWIAAAAPPAVLRWGIAVLFAAMAVWALIPDSLGARDGRRALGRGAFVASAVGFFIAEMGDKTQLATAGLAARYDAFAAVLLGTTLGMMIANVPVVLAGEALASRIDLRRVRICAAALFALFAIASAGGWMTL